MDLRPKRPNLSDLPSLPPSLPLSLCIGNAPLRSGRYKPTVTKFDDELEDEGFSQSQMAVLEGMGTVSCARSRSLPTSSPLPPKTAPLHTHSPSFSPSLSLSLPPSLPPPSWSSPREGRGKGGIEGWAFKDAGTVSGCAWAGLLLRGRGGWRGG